MKVVFIFICAIHLALYGSGCSLSLEDSCTATVKWFSEPLCSSYHYISLKNVDGSKEILDIICPFSESHGFKFVKVSDEPIPEDSEHDLRFYDDDFLKRQPKVKVYRFYNRELNFVLYYIPAKSKLIFEDYTPEWKLSIKRKQSSIISELCAKLDKAGMHYRLEKMMFSSWINKSLDLSDAKFRYTSPEYAKKYGTYVFIKDGGCCNSELIGPFRKALAGDCISHAHFENDKILFMDFLGAFQEIDSFDWGRYKMYIESPGNEVDAIGFAVSKQDPILNPVVLKKFFSKMPYVTENRKIKYGILFQSESKDIFLEKIPSLDIRTERTLRIDGKNLHRLDPLTDSVPVDGTEPCMIHISIDVLRETDFFAFLDKIRNSNVRFFFYSD